MNSNKRKLALLPLALLVLSSATPVMAHAESWAEKWDDQQYNDKLNATKKLITDYQIETAAANNEQSTIDDINNAFKEARLTQNEMNDLNILKNSAKNALSEYSIKAQQASKNKFTDNSTYIQDYFDSKKDREFDYEPGYGYSNNNQNNGNQSSGTTLNDNQISDYLEYLEEQNAVPIEPVDTSSIYSSINDNSQAIAKLEKEVADLQQAVSNKKKAANSTLSSDKKLLAKLNKKMHRKHLSKKAQHKLALQRKALLKAIQKLTK